MTIQQQAGLAATRVEGGAGGSAGGFQVEATSIGLQSLVPGVTPIGVAQRLALRAAAPLCASKPQRPLDHGLFDMNARNQLELFSPFAPAVPAGADAE